MVEQSRRRGIGVVVPYDFALDREMWRWAPPGRRPLRHQNPAPAPAGRTSRWPSGSASTRPCAPARADVLAAEPDVVLYLCTSGSFVRGVGGERHMREVMLAAGAPAAVTTSGALLDALAHVGVRTVSVVSPYLPALAARLDAFLAEAGVGVVAHRGLALDEHIFRVVHHGSRPGQGDRRRPRGRRLRQLHEPRCYDVIVDWEASGQAGADGEPGVAVAAVRRAGAAGAAQRRSVSSPPAPSRPGPGLGPQ